MKWKRPDGPYPQIYVKFEGKAEVNGKKRKFWVQDLTEEYFERVIDAFANDFLKDEPMCKFSKVLEEPDAVEDFKQLWMTLMAQKMSVICLTEGEDGETEIAGFNCLFVVHKDDVEEDLVKSPISKKLFGIVQYLIKDVNPFEKLGTDEYLYAIGLGVLEEFRGESLGLRILNAREPLCKNFGIKATLTVFTSVISQKLAYKDGFKVLHSLRYNKDFPPELQVPGITKHTVECKLMYKIFE